MSEKRFSFAAHSFFLRLLHLEEKLLLRCLPTVLLQTACLILLFALLAFAVVQSRSDSSDPLSVRIAAVFPDADPEENLLFRMAVSSADLPTVLTLDITDSDTALSMLRSSRAAGAVFFPEDFAECVMYGRETTLTIFLPENSEFENYLLEDLAHTAVSMLLDIQAGCYAAHADAASFGYGYALDDSGTEIAMVYVNTVFSRLNYFEEQLVRATGSLDTVSHYICSAVLLLLLLSGLSFGPLFSWKNPAFMQKLRTVRLHPLMQTLIPVLTITGFFAVLAAFGAGIAFCLPAGRAFLAHGNLFSVLNLAVVLCFCVSVLPILRRSAICFALPQHLYRFFFSGVF